jgi:uncharacterized membrane protein
MNLAHVHLVLNHFPVVGLYLSAILLGLGLIRKNEGYLKAGLLLVIVAGALVVPTYFTGEPAEDVIKEMQGFSEERVEEHEAAALFAICFTVLASLLAATACWISCKKKQIPYALVIGVFLLVLFTITVVSRTAYLGGMISHPEIR